jgi:carboxypeptidase family protein
MKKVLGLGLTLVVVSALVALDARPTHGSKGAFATITGTVKDDKGNPLVGALISVLKDGAKGVVKEIRTGADGGFAARVSPGRYGIRAIAEGFNEVIFSSVQVRASQELVYRFNLEPIGAGKTLPEHRRDRDDVRWRLRASQTRRSIFQVREGEDQDLKAVLGSEEETPGQLADTEADTNQPEKSSKSRTHGVIETYFASNNAFGPAFLGLNFAVATPASETLDLVFSGQTGLGPNAPERFEATGRMRVGDNHRIGLSVAEVQLGKSPSALRIENGVNRLGQISVRAIDEWIVRDGVVIVLGLDYSRFLGSGSAHSVSPRIGIQLDANGRTRVKAAYASGGDEGRIQSVASFEDAQAVFTDPSARPIAFIDGRAIMERSRRLEFGVERVLDNKSSVEATAFFDTTSGRGVGLLSTPWSAFSGATGEALINVANQQGAARGLRVVYTRRLSRVWTASAGYSFGRGQRLSPVAFANPSEVFNNGFFQTAALQLGAGIGTRTHVQTVLRFSPNATVFAIDPFAGRLAVYDPSLSIQVTQDLPTFGLPVRAEAVLDARNLLDVQASVDSAEVPIQLGTGRRSVRGGISVKF